MQISAYYQDYFTFTGKAISYKLLKSKFTTGLLYFSLILLIQNILLVLALAVFYLLGKEISQPDGTEHYTILLLINTAQLIAFFYSI